MKSENLHLIAFFILCILIRISQGSTCPTLECSDSIQAGHSTTGTTVTLNPYYCGDGQRCQYYKDFRSSMCTKDYNDDIQVFLYPGYYCQNYPGAKGVFGDKICSHSDATGSENSGICTGKHTYDTCERHSDCYYGHFGEHGKGVPEVGIGNYGYFHEACGRKGYCLHSNYDVNFGYGVEYASIDSSATAPVLAYDGTNFLYQEHAEKVCKSGWIDMTTGKCSNVLNSLNKGEPCTSDVQCTTSDPSIRASGKGSFNGSKICDILGADEQWEKAFSKFKTYLSVTEQYHSAEVLGQGMETPEYKEWFGAEFQAKHYVELLNAPKGFDRVMNSYHEYSEYYRTCMNSIITQATLITLLAPFLILHFW